MKNKPIQLFYPYVPKSVIKAVSKVLESRFIGQGPKVEEFEKVWEERISHPYKSIAVGSGTDALHLAYILAGIKEGDEVITPIFTCTATTTALLYQRAKPVFADCKKDSLNIDPISVKKLVNEKTKAIVCVHYGGLPVDLDELQEIADKWKIPVIEDAAQAHGALYKGRHIGAISDFTCFSGNTSIITEKGFKKIKDIKIGEKVLSGNGTYQKVINTLKRDYLGLWTKIRGATVSFTSTFNHPILIYRNGKDQWISAKDVSIGDYFYVATKLCTKCKKNLIPIYGKICSDCYIIIQNSLSKRIKLSKIKTNKNRLTSRLDHHFTYVVPYMDTFKKDGYRVIPLIHAIPDFLAIRDGKVLAVEIESTTTVRIGKQNKYKKIEPYSYDDIIWITRKANFKTTRYQYKIIGNLARILVRKVDTSIWYNNQRKQRTSKVYNLTVDSNHTYFAHNVLVHNCFSFQAIKIVTTADGGMVTIKNPELEEKVKRIRWFGIDRKAKLEDRWKNDIWEVGYKYQMTDISAVMGVEAMKVFDQTLEYHRRLFETYKQELFEVPGITFIGDDDDHRSSCWLATVLVEKRDDLKRKLAEYNIESNQVHYRNDQYTVFGGKVDHCPNMDKLEGKYLVLPMHHYVTVDQVKYICNIIRKGW